MPFKSVFASLQEVFPQVDLRILKAVAIEHSKDIDAAVEFVINEVLPSLNEPTEASYTLDDIQETNHSDAEVGTQKQGISLGHQGAVEENAGLLPRSLVGCESDTSTDHGYVAPKSSAMGEAGEDSKAEVDGSKSSLHHQESAEVVSVSNDESKDVTLEEHLSQLSEGLQENESDSLLANVGELCRTEDIPSSGLEDPPELIGCGSHSETAIFLNELEPQQSKVVTESGIELAASEAGTSSATDMPMMLATQSGHVISMDFLEEFITDVKSSKRTLLTATETVTNLMKEVEHRENKAKQAKEEASNAGQNILGKAEDIKEKLKHAKEANDMRAGEIYGEKAILATELRELQSRLFNLSGERDNLLSIIEEIHRILESRLKAAEEEQAAAEKEKHEKEDVARKILKEQEVIMEEIEEESRRLQKAAEENAKLREFLMDRGNIVDLLQGEVAVIRDDVKMLKGRAEGHSQLKKPQLSTTSSFASSSSSSHHRSMLHEAIFPPMELGESLQGTRREPAVCQQLANDLSGDWEHNTSNGKKPSSDDGWELFDPMF